MALKLKIYINGNTYEIDTSLNDAKGDVIRQLYQHEMAKCKNKTDAVYNIAAILDISESTVWRAIDGE